MVHVNDVLLKGHGTLHILSIQVVITNDILYHTAELYYW